jgi:hypothetical protein
MDLASTTQALIQMQERRKVYQFEMPLKSSEYGAPIKFEIRSKRELAGSPIDGYEILYRKALRGPIISDIPVLQLVRGGRRLPMLWPDLWPVSY